MTGISKAFPGVQALQNVDFEIYPGEVVALVGENGAGKSTLMKIVSGAYRRDAGQIYLGGHEVEIENPHHAQQMGIAIIYQEFNLTKNQTAAANIFIAREPKAGGSALRWGWWIAARWKPTRRRCSTASARGSTPPHACGISPSLSSR